MRFWQLYFLIIGSISWAYDEGNNISAFDTFVRAVKLAKNNALSNELTLTSSRYECALPRDAVIFSYANMHSLPIIHSFLKAMEINNVRNCLLQQLVILCLDGSCVEMCKRESIPLCPLVDLSAKLGDGTYGKPSYYFLTYIKHELISLALTVVQHVLFVDLDVLLFFNPWHEILYPFDKQSGKRIVSPYDFRYQREVGTEESCGGSINTGVLYLKNSTATQLLLKSVMSYKDKIVRLRRGNDQKFVNKIITTTPDLIIKACALPATRFTSYCLSHRNNNDIRYLDGYRYTAGDMVTFHAACCEGTHAKMMILNRVLYAAQHNRTSPLAHVLLM